MMAYQHHITRRVEFADTDMAGIMHFTAFFRFMEAAEHDFYRTLGFSVHTHSGEGVRSFPRVKAACEFKQPLRFEDEVEIHLLVRAKKAKSIDYDFIFRKLSPKAVPEAARGSMTVVYAGRKTGDRAMRAIVMPDEIALKIDEAPRALLD